MPKFFVDDIADGQVTLRTTSSNYRNSFQLATENARTLTAGERVEGTIHAPAWKVDRVEMGGNYVEPLIGRPRRMQGTILSINVAKNELTVKVGYDVTVRMPERYRASDFQVGQRIGWDNIDVPTFVLAGSPSLLQSA